MSAGESAFDGRALAGRVAVISGGGRGIGRAIARRYAAEGATVVISARTRSDLDDVVAGIAEQGGRALAVTADASTPGGRPRRRSSTPSPSWAASTCWSTTSAAPSAGATTRSPPTATASRRTLDLNLTSVWWASTAALPTMREQGSGSIISIGSGAAIRASAGVAYVAAKHGMVGLTKALAAQAAASGITVNMLSPGWTDTSLVDFERIAERTGTTPEAARESAEAESAQRRILDPDRAHRHGRAARLGRGSGHHRPGHPRRRRLPPLTDPGRSPVRRRREPPRGWSGSAATGHQDGVVDGDLGAVGVGGGRGRASAATTSQPSSRSAARRSARKNRSSPHCARRRLMSDGVVADDQQRAARGHRVGAGGVGRRSVPPR